MESKAIEKRKLILQTATNIILRQDFNALTLDAVAKEAGISKGGLLYHFPNKETLIKALAEHILRDFTKSFYKEATHDQDETGKWCRALIAASKQDLEQNAELNVGVFAASLLHDELTKKTSENYQEILNHTENDGIDPTTATIIRLAIDGLYYSQLLHFAPLQEDMQQKVIERLVQMTKKEHNL